MLCNHGLNQGQLNAAGALHREQRPQWKDRVRPSVRILGTGAVAALRPAAAPSRSQPLLTGERGASRGQGPSHAAAPGRGDPIPGVHALPPLWKKRKRLVVWLGRQIEALGRRTTLAESDEKLPKKLVCVRGTGRLGESGPQSRVSPPRRLARRSGHSCGSDHTSNLRPWRVPRLGA